MYAPITLINNNMLESVLKWVDVWIPCGVCGGSGSVPADRGAEYKVCPTCKGSGGKWDKEWVDDDDDTRD